MENKIKQTYKLQEPKPTLYKRVISTSYSSSISRQKPLLLNTDINHHLNSPSSNLQNTLLLQKQELYSQDVYNVIGSQTQSTTVNNHNLNYSADKTDALQQQQNQQQLLMMSNTSNNINNTNREYMIKNLHIFNSNLTRPKQYRTQRDTLDNQSQHHHSGQFDLNKPLFNNPILNQTQDYSSASNQQYQYGHGQYDGSKQQLLPDVSQQTIPLLEQFNQKYQQHIGSQGRQRNSNQNEGTKFRNHIRDISTQAQQKRPVEHNLGQQRMTAQNGQRQIFLDTQQKQSENGILLNESKVINRDDSIDIKQQKLNLLNRSFMIPNQNHKKPKYPRFSNDFQSVNLSTGRHIYGRNHQSQDSSMQQQDTVQPGGASFSQQVTTSTQPQQNHNQVSLLRNQRLKLLDSIKKKSQQPQSQDVTTKGEVTLKQSSQQLKMQTKLSQNLDHMQDIDKDQNSEITQQNHVNSQYLIQSHPQTFRGLLESQHITNINNLNQSQDLNIMDSDSVNQSKHLLNDASIMTSNFEQSFLQSQNQARHIVINKKYTKSAEIGTQTGNGEFLQTLSNQKHQNLKKIIDNLAKEVDIREIDIEAKSRMKNYDKIHSCKEKHQIYHQSVIKLFDTLFGDQQIFGQKMTQIIKKQFKRFTSGLEESFSTIINTLIENYQRHAQQFQVFKFSLQKLSDQLKDTHIQLIKEKEMNYEEYLKLDKEHPTRKAFELLGSLNTLLQDQTKQLQIPANSLQNTVTQQQLSTEQQQVTITDIDMNTLGDNYQNEAVSILEEFEKIDQLPDAFDRKMRKTQLLMQLQATDVTRTLKEVHQILVLKNNSILNKDTTLVSMQDQVKDEQRQLQLLEQIECEISQRFTNVQKLTALKVLNRYYKPKRFREIDVQTDENKIYEKYLKKKDLIRELRSQKETIERQSVDFGRQLKFSIDENMKMKTHLKLQEVTLKDQEEKLTELVKKEAYFKVKNDDLNRRLTDLDSQHQKMKQEREYLQQKIAKKIEKMSKLQLQMNELTFNKNENERRMKSQIEQLQENYKVMSEAYVKERKERESLMMNSKMDASALRDSLLNDSQLSNKNSPGGHLNDYDSKHNRVDTQHSKSESPKKSQFASSKIGVRSYNNSNARGSGQNQNNVRNFNTSGSQEDSILEDEYENGKRRVYQGGSKQDNSSLNKNGNQYSKSNKGHGKGQEGNSDEEEHHQHGRNSSELHDANHSYDNSKINLKSLIKHDNQDASLTNTLLSKTVKFSESLLNNQGNNHRSMIYDDINHGVGQDDMLLGEDQQDQLDKLNNMTSTNRRNHGGGKYDNFKFADYMKPTKQKSSSKHVTQFDDMSYHLLHMEKCGPNCIHLIRSNMRSPNKNKRQLLPLKKQKLELDD